MGLPVLAITVCAAMIGGASPAKPPCARGMPGNGNGRGDRWRRRNPRRRSFHLGDAHGREAAVEAWVDGADALRQRRMRVHHVEERLAHAVAEEHVAGFLGVRRLELRAEAQAADLLQRAGQARRVARELHRRGVGEKLALPADGRLDEPAEEDANPANHDQRQPQQRQRVLVLAAAAAGVEQDPADDRQAKDAEDDAHQAQVEPHVAVEDVAELVADHALQFVAREQLHGAGRDGDDGVARGVAGGERVDASFLGQQIDLRHRHTRGDGHFLHHVPQLALVRVGRGGIDQAPAQHRGDRAAALGQLQRLEPAAQGNDGQRADGSPEEKLRIPEHHLRLLAVTMVMARAEAGKDPQHRGVNRHDEHGDAEDEIDDQELGVAAGLVLTLEEVHCQFPISNCQLPGIGNWQSAIQNETLGASFSSGFSMTKSSAGPKLKGPAIMLVGNVSRCVL